MNTITSAFKGMLGLGFILLSGWQPAAGAPPSICKGNPRETPVPQHTLVLSTDALVKNDPAQCSLLDAFQIVNDGKNSGTNSCGAITIGNKEEVVLIDAGDKTFLPTNEIFLGRNTALVRSALFDAEAKTRVFRVATDNAHLILEDVSIFGGKSHSGGAILVEQGGNLSTYDVKFEDNEAVTDGGAIAFQSYGNIDLRKTLFKLNHAGRNGGALSITGSDGAVIQESRILENYALAQGGGVYMDGGADLDVVGSYVEKNQAVEGNGGGIYAAGQMTVYCTLVFDNRAKSGNGGGMYVQPASGIALIQASSFDSNRAGKAGIGKGGGVFVGDDFTAQHSAFTGNYAGTDGGGLYIDDAAADDSIRLENITIAINQATRGGALWITGLPAVVELPDDYDSLLMGGKYSFQIFHATIHDNHAEDAQIYVDSAAIAAFDEILFLNNIVNSLSGVPGCAGFVQRLLPGRLNDPEPYNDYNVQWPGESCGKDIPVAYGSGAIDYGWLFQQAYAPTIVGNAGDLFACSWVYHTDQFNRMSKCRLGAARRGPPPKVDDPDAPM